MDDAYYLHLLGLFAEQLRANLDRTFVKPEVRFSVEKVAMAERLNGNIPPYSMAIAMPSGTTPKVVLEALEDHGAMLAVVGIVSGLYAARVKRNAKVVEAVFASNRDHMAVFCNAIASRLEANGIK